MLPTRMMRLTSGLASCWAAGAAEGWPPPSVLPPLTAFGGAATPPVPWPVRPASGAAAELPHAARTTAVAAAARTRGRARPPRAASATWMRLIAPWGAADANGHMVGTSLVRRAPVRGPGTSIDRAGFHDAGDRIGRARESAGSVTEDEPEEEQDAEGDDDQRQGAA